MLQLCRSYRKNVFVPMDAFIKAATEFFRCKLVKANVCFFGYTLFVLSLSC